MKATFLSRFTPSLMAPEALEALFVQREGLAQRIVELIRDSALTPSKHHILLIGPRGIGKTHLVALIYHRVRAMTDLHGRLLIAWLREEEWGVMSFLDLLLRIFRALLTEHDDAALAERVESLYNLPPDAAECVGGALLKEFVGNRTLLVLVENLDELFKGLDGEGQKRLRAYLQENPFCTILATAQSLFNGVSLQTSPFYGFFRTYHLEELGFDDATRLLTKIADFEGDRELASFIQTPMGRARIRAVHHLAGGNHRVYVILSQFLTRESLDELVGPFIRTLDDLTPYYQARMAWLSPQQRKIVEFLCDRRHAVPVKDIAQRCFMTHQTASGQLKTLREMGYVRSESMGRESYYELREPLMRLCVEVKKKRGEPIRLLVGFLRLWHSRVELQQQLALLALNRWDEGTVVLDDALHRFAHVDEPHAGDTGAIVRNLFISTHDAATWRTHITTLIGLYDKHQVLLTLGQGLVRGISALNSPMASDTAARTWRDVWQELAGNRKEFELPLRLLDAAVRHRETHDPRVLLELAVEERTLLEPLLGVEKPQGREPAPPLPRSTQRLKRQSRRGSKEKAASL